MSMEGPLTHAMTVLLLGVEDILPLFLRYKLSTAILMCARAMNGFQNTFHSPME